MPLSPEAVEPPLLGMMMSATGEAKRKSARKMKGAGVMIDKKLRIPAVFQKAQPTSAPIARETAKARKVAENGPRANCSATSAASRTTKMM